MVVKLSLLNTSWCMKYRGNIFQDLILEKCYFVGASRTCDSTGVYILLVQKELIQKTFNLLGSPKRMLQNFKKYTVYINTIWQINNKCYYICCLQRWCSSQWRSHSSCSRRSTLARITSSQRITKSFTKVKYKIYLNLHLCL